MTTCLCFVILNLTFSMQWPLVPVYDAVRTVDFHVSTDILVQNWFLTFWFLPMCSSALSWFVTIPLLFH